VCSPLRATPSGQERAAEPIVAGIGVYSVLSTLVAQQLREIGVRLMLGAEPSAMARRVFGGGLALAGLGVTLGLAATALSSRILSRRSL
jgi:ABC-type antimicrobial peptide transport system permease subunit